MIKTLAAIYWDPNSTLIVLPWIDHPIRWYGVLFALGFLAGYLVVTRILTERLYRAPCLTADQVIDWRMLAALLRSGSQRISDLGAIIQKLDPHSLKELQALSKGSMPGESLQKAILKAYNEMLEGGPGNITRRRDRLDLLLKDAILSISSNAYRLADRLALFLVVGTLVGARLGHVFFYDWLRYQNDWIGILRVWEGGLASHGGAVGIVLAITLFWKTLRGGYRSLGFLALCDSVAVPAGLAGCCIRVGNFINQEILGTESQVPWAVIFGNPMDGTASVARHPVQLYEAFCYLIIFWVLFRTWVRFGSKLADGALSGWFLLLTFSSRFVLEYFKEPQGDTPAPGDLFLMGQWLSLPFILLGLALLIFSYRSTNEIIVSKRTI